MNCMASLNSTITINLNEEDRQLIKKLVGFLEALNESDELKLLAKKVIDLNPDCLNPDPDPLKVFD